MIRMVYNRTGRFPQRLDYRPEELDIAGGYSA